MFTQQLQFGSRAHNLNIYIMSTLHKEAQLAGYDEGFRAWNLLLPGHGMVTWHPCSAITWIAEQLYKVADRSRVLLRKKYNSYGYATLCLQQFRDGERELKKWAKERMENLEISDESFWEEEEPRRAIRNMLHGILGFVDCARGHYKMSNIFYKIFFFPVFLYTLQVLHY